MLLWQHNLVVTKVAICGPLSLQKHSTFWIIVPGGIYFVLDMYLLNEFHSSAGFGLANQIFTYFNLVKIAWFSRKSTEWMKNAVWLRKRGKQYEYTHKSNGSHNVPSSSKPIYLKTCNYHCLWASGASRGLMSRK